MVTAWRILKEETNRRTSFLKKRSKKLLLYPVYAITRKSIGVMIRKLSETLSHMVRQFSGTGNFGHPATALSCSHPEFDPLQHEPPQPFADRPLARLERIQTI
jgi:hypothetical protein